MAGLPHPIPYQGSKRNLAAAILDVLGARPVRCLCEPFAGSAAITIAAAHRGIARRFLLGDSLAPLIEIWRSIVAHPTALATDYRALWTCPKDDQTGHYARIRDEFNVSGDPAKLLYLLVRCVKNSPRWNREGRFNQSEDRRRLGMRPEKMAREIAGVYRLLHGKTEATAGDFASVMADSKPSDLVYLDPPWEGTSQGRDRRYHSGLARETLLAALESLNLRGVPWILSYDGQCGGKTYGAALPPELRAMRIPLTAGRSSQATLNGRSDVTIESLYLSEALAKSLRSRASDSQSSVL